jgi:acyl-CoA thioester hydrolase
VHRLRVRYSECDPQGIVFNANYVTFFDIALTELWRAAIGRYDAMVQAGVDMVVAEARARYLAPAGFDDVLEIETDVERLGRTSMITRHTVRREGTVVVEGEMRHVFVDARRREKTPIPDDVRAALAGGEATSADPALEHPPAR